MNKKLQELRKENAGYNPENQSLYECNYDTSGPLTVAIVEDEDGYETRYMETKCQTEEEYITLYPSVYGIIINNVFFKQL